MSLNLFPLGTVLYPGSLLPLHIFESRYRRMVSDLLDQSDGRRRFGVVAIKAGREAWDDGLSDLHVTGCTAVLQRVEAYHDGRYDILAIGESRFQLDSVDTTSDLLSGTVKILTEATTMASPALAGKVGRLFTRYLVALREAGGIHSEDDDEELPPDPTALSFFVADGMILDVNDKQALLAARDTDARLTLELEYLRREAAMVRQFSMRPAVELPRVPYSSN
ncbi:LON peptidase substrate-binding domain-containing protein [Nakamurella sp. PAMC28650]|uniref:LON peptidase substrate-binding domain-containing protein n=1 Tax=Nakamurella sp. PAMC28650 TaxID=2762325 RepID=UPI00164DD6BC|nr:LON peptidase substrate-binding domain-containing protein [Nakamurella sp. PAMC28650]QNK79234.1 LON peptidase substrate-binding domain-containing protein [Nakamurella sp. PAMC28650]